MAGAHLRCCADMNGTRFEATLLAHVLPILSFAAYIGIVAYYFIPRGMNADVQ